MNMLKKYEDYQRERGYRRVQTWQLHNTNEAVLLFVALMPSGKVYVEHADENSVLEYFRTMGAMVREYHHRYGAHRVVLEQTPLLMETFHLDRQKEDDSMQQVAYGVQFPSALCVVEWHWPVGTSIHESVLSLLEDTKYGDTIILKSDRPKE